jgi:hypothetical protein
MFRNESQSCCLLRDMNASRDEILSHGLEKARYARFRSSSLVDTSCEWRSCYANTLSHVSERAIYSGTVLAVDGRSYRAHAMQS